MRPPFQRPFFASIRKPSLDVHSLGWIVLYVGHRGIPWLDVRETRCAGSSPWWGNSRVLYTRPLPWRTDFAGRVMRCYLEQVLTHLVSLVQCARICRFGCGGSCDQFSIAIKPHLPLAVAPRYGIKSRISQLGFECFACFLPSQIVSKLF